MEKHRSIEYDCTYMQMAICMSKLSYAVRNKVGAIIVSKNGQIISQGFNGTPTGTDNCCEDVICNYNSKNCIKENNSINTVISVQHCKDCDYCKLVTRNTVLHAESNAITKCAKWTNTTEDATIYVTLSPCHDCAKLIIQSGIKRVVFNELYRNTDGLDFLVDSKIQVQQLDMNKKILIDWKNINTNK